MFPKSRTFILFIVIGLIASLSNLYAASFFDCPGPACPSVSGDSIRSTGPTRNFDGNPKKTESNNRIDIFFQNACGRTIYSAITYKGLDDKWVTNGWFDIRSGLRVKVGTTKNKVFYIHARTGASQETSRNHSLSVTNAQFIWKGNAAFIPVQNSKKKFGFLEKNISHSATNKWIEVFECR